ncbi:LOW QUALITY PROTEIN: relaxin-3b [Clupea harengus]|uniref:Relaxin-3 n=1 Tax=Clupea harengus TaxID=7950 RepID=A0A6P3VRQ7_CLUHA|nr:LOW QUALITY PROTEIN: relaxin-3b [Clupea harengus]
MWKAAALAVGLLMALVVLPKPQKGNPIYGVKLCGREFIRAVIFTCGGSRWKRSLGMPGELENEPLSHDTDSTGRWNSAYKQHLEAEAEAWRGEGEDGGVFSRQARSLISEEVLEALRTSDRKGRDVVVGLSNACCKWGCSKSEISSLC